MTRVSLPDAEFAASLATMDSIKAFAAAAPEEARRYLSKERGRIVDPELTNKFLYVLTTSVTMVDASSREVEVKVGTQKEDKQASADNKETSATGRLGLAVRSLSAEERKQIDGKGGLRVENAAGAAARAGIRPGDIVLSVNGEPVSTPEQLRSLVSKAGKRVALLVQRDDARLFVPIDLN